MRFTTAQDYTTILKINKELVNTVVDVETVLYKMHQELTKTNVYGEATNKVWYKGVTIPALIRYDATNPTADMQTTNVQQNIEVSYLRQECSDREVYPEVGDIISFNSSYYEINNTNEIQLFAGRTEYNHSIVCSAHLTRKTNLQLDAPQL
jgi:hypothetical protein